MVIMAVGSSILLLHPTNLLWSRQVVKATDFDSVSESLAWVRIPPPQPIKTHTAIHTSSIVKLVKTILWKRMKCRFESGCWVKLCLVIKNSKIQKVDIFQNFWYNNYRKFGKQLSSRMTVVIPPLKLLGNSLSVKDQNIEGSFKSEYLY